MTAKSAATLLAAWEALGRGLADGYELGLDDWLNDADGRRLLAEALAADADTAAHLAARVAAADAAVRAATTASTQCLWGSANASAHGYRRERDWWYFVVPKRCTDGFRADLKRVR